MNIPDDKVANYPKEDVILVNDARIVKGTLSLAKTWGEEAIKEGGSSEVVAVDEILAEFTNKIADIRAKYEVEGDLLNGASELEVKYLDELNTLLEKYRALIFQAMLDFVSDDTAVDLMLDVFPDPKGS